MSEFTLLNADIFPSRTLLDEAEEALDAEEMEMLFDDLDWDEDEIVALAARFG
jgi:hypothetical protein